MNLIFRTDASVAIGTGHVMRCLALAQAWQDAGGRAMFAMAESTPAIESRLRSESCDVVSISSTAGLAEDAGHAIALARTNQAEWIVVDGYQFDADYQRALKSAGLNVLFLDDYGHARHYSADLVLNHNVCATKALYANRELYTQLLLGPRYCLLRREFAGWQNWKREVPSTVQRLLVVMGGSDPKNLTLRVIEAVSKLDGLKSLEVAIVVGGSNPHLTTLQNSADRPELKIEVRRDVSDMAELMASADIAVSAAGSTCWELCLLALPALLIDVAANQTALALDLDRRGCAIHIGDQTVSAQKIAQQLERLLRSHELRRSLSRRSRELVDGDGASRVVSVLRRNHSRDPQGLHLRRARADDVRILWEWANDSDVRAASFSSAPIPWETHVAWFAEKMDPARSLIFIAEDEKGAPCGQIRFDFEKDGDAVLNISLAKEKRGHGLGLRVIEAGVRELFASTTRTRVHAFVKLDNVASTNAFQKAGFAKVGIERVRQSEAIHFVFERK